MRFEGRARVSTRIDMAPLIDVVFLLLIFFLLTSSFVSRRAVDLNLPGSDTAVAVAEAPVLVRIFADGSIRVGDDRVAEDSLAGIIAMRIARTPDRQVAVEADRDVDVQRLLTVLDAVRSGGGESISLMTKPGDGP